MFLIAMAIAVAGCTETPGWFPPCVNNAPCPDLDADVDGDAFGDGATLDASDEAPDAAAGDAGVDQ
jgi:hypothetical protein